MEKAVFWHIFFLLLYGNSSRSKIVYSMHKYSLCFARDFLEQRRLFFCHFIDIIPCISALFLKFSNMSFGTPPYFMLQNDYFEAFYKLFSLKVKFYSFESLKKHSCNNGFPDRARLCFQQCLEKFTDKSNAVAKYTNLTIVIQKIL